MLKPNQTIKAKWNSRNKTWFTSKGYTFTKMGEEFEVRVEDLTNGSKSKVIVLCDYCGTPVEKTYQTYLKQHDPELGDCCKIHQHIKALKTFREKYHVDNPGQYEEFKQKSIQTCMEKYGTQKACQTEEVKDKIRATCMKKYNATNYLVSTEGREKVKNTVRQKYGVDCVLKSEEIKDKIKVINVQKYGYEHPLQSPEIKEKREQTFIERYGFSSYSQTQECKDRITNTNMEKYGYKYTLQVPEIRRKGMETLLKNGKVPTSSQQLKIYEMLKENFEHCKLNEPCGNCFLDCAVIVDGTKIDVEYDGEFWHQDRQRDRRRDEFVKSQGYKVLRIRGQRQVPTVNEILNSIKELTSSDKMFHEIDLV